jgi:hypothetical protein
MEREEQPGLARGEILAENLSKFAVSFVLSYLNPYTHASHARVQGSAGVVLGKTAYRRGKHLFLFDVSQMSRCETSVATSQQ